MTTVEAPYDAEVECLESTGTQWIDLGFIPQDDTCVECVVGRNPELYMGVQRAWERNSYRYSEFDQRTYWVYGAVTADYSYNLGIMPTIMHDVKIVGPTCYVNGKTSTSRGTTPILCTGNFFYGALNVAGTAIASACFLGPIKIQLGGIYGSTTIDMIPVRFTNELGQSEGAMYDKVSGQLFRNQGTGSFAVGPDVRPYSTTVMGLHFMREPVTARSYAQDGLVAMWDGIENAGWGVHDAAATTWSNLMGGGYDFSLTARGSFGMDSLICAGAGSACGFADRLSSFVSMEAVLRWDTSISGAYQMAFATAFNGKAIMQYFNASRSLLAFNSYYQISLGRDAEYLARRHHISVEYAGTADGAKVVSAVLDGSSVAVVNSTSTGYSVEAGKMFVGGQDTGSAKPFFGEICALRLYSRALTAAEIAANYAIDRERFNLP